MPHLPGRAREGFFAGFPFAIAGGTPAARLGEALIAVDNAMAFDDSAGKRALPCRQPLRNKRKWDFPDADQSGCPQAGGGVFAERGLTLSQAFHLFLQQSINVGGLPFLVVRDGGKRSGARPSGAFSMPYEKGRNLLGGKE